MQKLSERDKKTLKIGGVCAVVLLILIFGTAELEKWSDVRAEAKMKTAQLKGINLSDAKHSGLLSIVPAFEMPEKEEAQKNRFRDKLVDQLKKAGIKTEPLKVITTKKTLYKSGGKDYKLMNIQCKGKCKFTQVLDLLARLNENPYLVGVELFKMKCDKSKPQEVELELTVSTAYLPG